MGYDWFERCVIAAVAVLVAGVVVGLSSAIAYGTAESRARRACLEAGYPSAQVDSHFNAYCIKRIDQTDTVVALKKVRR